MSAPVRAAALLLSVLLWSPTLLPLLAGAVPLDVALLRYAGALVLSLVGCAGLSALVRQYAGTSTTPPEPPRRRADDAPGPQDERIA